MNPPTTIDEINRKSVEEAERLLLYLSQGKINKGQFESSMTTLWNAVSGLCSTEIMNLMAEMKRAYCPPKGVKPGTCFVLGDDRGRMLIIKHRAGTGIVHVLRTDHSRHPNITRLSFEDREIPSLDAVEATRELLAKAARQGYKSLFADTI